MSRRQNGVVVNPFLARNALDPAHPISKRRTWRDPGRDRARGVPVRHWRPYDLRIADGELAALAVEFRAGEGGARFAEAIARRPLSLGAGNPDRRRYRMRSSENSIATFSLRETEFVLGFKSRPNPAGRSRGRRAQDRSRKKIFSNCQAPPLFRKKLGSVSMRSSWPIPVCSRCDLPSFWRQPRPSRHGRQK